MKSGAQYNVDLVYDKKLLQSMNIIDVVTYAALCVRGGGGGLTSVELQITSILPALSW